MSTSRRPSNRPGFTLVEVLIVIAIIAILMTILVPVLGAIMRKAKEAAVRTEITSLENAIADFKATYGANPPGHIHLYEAGGGWPTNTADGREARGIMRRLWPRFNFSIDRDFNGNGSIDDDPDGDNVDGVHLSGAECLVLFLGGTIRRDANGRPFLVGFSKNPANPFAPPSSPNESRVGPFYEFDASRLIDIDNYPSHDTNNDGVHYSDGFPEYSDNLPNQVAPYLYINSATSGSGFDVDSWVVYSTPAFNLAVGAYRQGSLTGPFFKARSFQIISPGYGPHENNAGIFRPYGTGGVYDSDNTSALSAQDGDNITNFGPGGRLKP